MPYPTGNSTRGNVEQLRSTNNGDLVGIGDRAEVGEFEAKSDEPEIEEKIEEPQDEIKEEKLNENEGSGDAR